MGVVVSNASNIRGHYSTCKLKPTHFLKKMILIKLDTYNFSRVIFSFVKIWTCNLIQILLNFIHLTQSKRVFFFWKKLIQILSRIVDGTKWILLCWLPNLQVGSRANGQLANEPTFYSPSLTHVTIFATWEIYRKESEFLIGTIYILLLLQIIMSKILSNTKYNRIS